MPEEYGRQRMLEEGEEGKLLAEGEEGNLPVEYRVPQEESSEFTGEWSYIGEEPSQQSQQQGDEDLYGNGGGAQQQGNGSTSQQQGDSTQQQQQGDSSQQSQQQGESRREVEDSKEVKEAKEAYERKRVEAATAMQQKQITESKAKEQALRKSKYELGREQRKEGAQAMQKVLTLGGVPMSQSERRELYFGKAKRSLYGPTAPKEPFSKNMGAAEYLKPSTSEEVKSLHRPSFSKLKEAGPKPAKPSQAQSEYARQLVQPGGEGLRHSLSFAGSPQGLNYGFLREFNTPKGLSQGEQYAYSEIRANHDRDTARHVVSELGQMGVPRRDAEQALRGLLQKGHVRRVQDSQGEEPIFEITQESSEQSPIMALSKGQSSGIGLVGGLRA